MLNIEPLGVILKQAGVTQEMIDGLDLKQIMHIVRLIKAGCPDWTYRIDTTLVMNKGPYAPGNPVREPDFEQ